MGSWSRHPGWAPLGGDVVAAEPSSTRRRDIFPHAADPAGTVPPVLVRDLQIPDPAGPPEGFEAGTMGPSAPLVPFRPDPADPDDVVGATVQGWTASAGTYGMGGPGFVALDLGGRWLVVTLWGAGSWIRLDDRLLDDVPRDEPGVLVGWEIAECVVERTWMAVDLAAPGADGHSLRLAADPSDRPAFPDGRPRAFAPTDDLRTAVVLAPTTEIWV